MKLANTLERGRAGWVTLSTVFWAHTGVIYKKQERAGNSGKNLYYFLKYPLAPTLKNVETASAL